MRTLRALVFLVLVPASALPGAEPGHAAFSSAWQRYADEVSALPLQPDCVPRMLPAQPRAERRGAVVMFHGFGGCPQQMFEFAERIATQGFDVLLPLLPGHGERPNADGEEQLDRLPDGDSWPRYTEFAARMIDMMAFSAGTNIVVGFSLGGAVALNAGLRAPDRFDRMLLLAPMFAFPGAEPVEQMATLVGRTPGFREIVVKPGGIRDECDAWQAAGRAGFCDYRYEHGAALAHLAGRNRRLREERPLTLPTQIVGAGDEKYVSNRRLTSFAETERLTAPVELCFLPDDVPHEMLTPYENIGRDMYWLDDLMQGLVRFVVEGEFMPAPQCIIENAD
ncbi:MAG: alpha/beta hydrolase [Gammaproteobacteria bacterium]